MSSWEEGEGKGGGAAPPRGSTPRRPLQLGGEERAEVMLRAAAELSRRGMC